MVAARSANAAYATVVRLLSTNPDVPGFFAFGQIAVGVIAVGQFALGVVAVGQVARGVIAINVP